MKARCPTCKFIYNINSSILKEANFKVVCAECHNVFKVEGNHFHPEEDGDTEGTLDQNPGKDPEMQDVLADLQQSLDRLDTKAPHHQADTEILEDLDISLNDQTPPIEDAALPDTVFTSELGKEFEDDSYLFMSEPASVSDDSLLSDTLFASELEDIAEPSTNRREDDIVSADQPETLFAEDLDDPYPEIQTSEEGDGDQHPDKEPLQPAFLRQKKSTSILAILSLIILTVVALVQFSWIEKERFLQIPLFQAAATNLCPYLGCELPKAHKAVNFTIVDRSLQPESQPGNYRLDILLRNDSKTSQLLPDLRLSLLDDKQVIVARRTFAGKTYSAASTADKQLKPGEILEIHLKLHSPEQAVSGFKLDFVPATS